MCYPCGSCNFMCLNCQMPTTIVIVLWEGNEYNLLYEFAYWESTKACTFYCHGYSGMKATAVGVANGWKDFYFVFAFGYNGCKYSSS